MKSTYDIALLPGDGTGPEVIREGRKVLEAAAGRFGFRLNFVEYDDCLRDVMNLSATFGLVGE